jgi:hypothetical protein
MGIIAKQKQYLLDTKVSIFLISLKLEFMEKLWEVCWVEGVGRRECH